MDIRLRGHRWAHWGAVGRVGYVPRKWKYSYRKLSSDLLAWHPCPLVPGAGAGVVVRRAWWRLLACSGKGPRGQLTKERCMWVQCSTDLGGEPKLDRRTSGPQWAPSGHPLPPASDLGKWARGQPGEGCRKGEVSDLQTGSLSSEALSATCLPVGDGEQNLILACGRGALRCWAVGEKAATWLQSQGAGVVPRSCLPQNSLALYLGSSLKEPTGHSPCPALSAGTWD